MIFTDSSISAMRIAKRSQLSPWVPTGILNWKSS